MMIIAPGTKMQPVNAFRDTRLEEMLTETSVRIIPLERKVDLSESLFGKSRLIAFGSDY
jgi:hypothetical protein